MTNQPPSKAGVDDHADSRYIPQVCTLVPRIACSSAEYWGNEAKKATLNARLTYAYGIVLYYLQIGILSIRTTARTVL